MQEIYNVIQEWSADKIQQLVFTSRQLNTIPDRPLPVFNTVVVCPCDMLQATISAVKSCYDNIDVAYWYNTGIPTTGIHICIIMCLVCVAVLTCLIPYEQEQIKAS